MRSLRRAAPAALVAIGVLASTAYAGDDTPADINVEIREVDGEKEGVVRCGLYDNSNWLEPDSALQWVDAEKTEDGSRVCRFEAVATGTYGVGAFHDADADHDMDSNVFGIPTEGVCVSTDPDGGMGPPDFSGAKFDHDGDETSVPCTMRY